MNSSVASLRSVPLFSGLSDPALVLVEHAAVRRVYGAGEIIILEGAPCRAAYFLVSGKVGVFRSSPMGREQVLVRLGPGQGFNTVPLFQSSGRNHASVKALTSVEVLCIPSDAFRRLVGECAEVALALLGDFAERLDHLTELVEDLSLRSVRGRVARFLLEHAEDDSVTERWTQEEIASQIGTVRDMVGRALRSFADTGLLRIDRHQIVLVDRNGLEAEAQR